jgi:hypothetical protein
MARDQRQTLQGQDDAGGLLLAAFQAGEVDIQWTNVTVDDLIVTVASDAMKATINGRAGVRLPVTYKEAVVICAALGCVSPTQRICDAMFAQAKAQVNAVELWTPATAAKMNTVGTVLHFNDIVESQLARRALQPVDLVFGGWKLWILHPNITAHGAVNYGFWETTRKPVVVRQEPGDKHDALYTDYSQLLMPVKRTARRGSTGEAVDLLDYIASREKVPAAYLNPYR